MKAANVNIKELEMLITLAINESGEESSKVMSLKKILADIKAMLIEG